MATPEPQSILIYTRRRSEEIMKAESTRNSPDGFTLWGDLSDEDDWKLLLGGKRRTRVPMPKRPTCPYELCASYKVPVLLQTNFEARQIAMKVYKLSFGHQLHQKPVLFDSSRDTLIMGSTGVLQMFNQGPFALKQYRKRIRQDAEDVRRLALCQVSISEDYDYITDRGLKYFKNLNSLFILTHSHKVMRDILPGVDPCIHIGHQEHECDVKGIPTKVMNARAFKIEFPAFQHWRLAEYEPWAVDQPHLITLNNVEIIRKQSISAHFSRYLFKLRKQNFPDFDTIYSKVRRGTELFPPSPRVKNWMKNICLS
jgi:hypothetical protein